MTLKLLFFAIAGIGGIVLSQSMMYAGKSHKEKNTAAEYVLYVGTYAPKGTGISIFRLDAKTGGLTFSGISTPIKNPSYLVIHPNNTWVFAVSEVGDGTVSAFRITGPSTLELVNTVSTKGADPCYCSIDNTGRYVLAANYSSGSVTSVPINKDGSLGDPASTIANTATSVNKVRQSAPHAHSVVPSRADDLVYSADLGADIIYGYRLDKATGTLSPASKTSTAQGAGPRHLAFHPNTKWAYAVDELSVCVDGFTIDPVSGALANFQSTPMLKENASGATAADIHIAPSGKFLYASVRDPENIIVVYSIDPKTGKLTRASDVPTGGKGPRNFAIDPSGRFLLVANQKTDAIVVFSIDERSGALTQIGNPVSTPSPVCIQFAR
jgi:6-phosphogluconolactonase